MITFTRTTNTGLQKLGWQQTKEFTTINFCHVADMLQIRIHYYRFQESQSVLNCRPMVMLNLYFNWSKRDWQVMNLSSSLLQTSNNVILPLKLVFTSSCTMCSDYKTLAYRLSFTFKTRANTSRSDNSAANSCRFPLLYNCKISKAIAICQYRDTVQQKANHTTDNHFTVIMLWKTRTV